MYVKQIIKDFLKENKYTFTLYFLTYIILYSLEFIGISVVLGKLVTILKQNKLKNFKFSLDLLSSFKYGYIYNIVLILCVLYLLNFSLTHLVNNIYNKLYSKLFSFIRIKLTKNLINNKKVNFKNLEVCKDLISLDLTSHYISTFIDNLLTEIIPLIIFTFVVLVFLFIIGLEYGLVFFITICSVIFYILYQKDKIIKTAKDKESVYLDMVNNSENSFSNLANILINNTSEYEIGKNSKLTNKFKNGIIKLYDIINKTVYNIRCMLAFFIFILLMLIFTNFKQNKIKLSMTIIFIFVLTNYIMFFRNKIYKIIVNFKYVGQIDINKEQFDILLENKNKNNNNNNKKKLSIK